jgi:hypothetical protein
MFACKLTVHVIFEGYISAFSSLVCNVSHHYEEQDGQNCCILLSVIPGYALWLQKIRCFKIHNLFPIPQGHEFKKWLVVNNNRFLTMHHFSSFRVSLYSVNQRVQARYPPQILNVYNCKINTGYKKFMIIKLSSISCRIIRHSGSASNMHAHPPSISLTNSGLFTLCCQYYHWETEKPREQLTLAVNPINQIIRVIKL